MAACYSGIPRFSSTSTILWYCTILLSSVLMVSKLSYSLSIFILIFVIIFFITVLLLSFVVSIRLELVFPSTIVLVCFNLDPVLESL